MFRARERQLVREHNERMTLAWHVAVLVRTGKRFPKLESLQVKTFRSHRQTAAQQLAIAQLWASRGYGVIRQKVN